MAAPKGNQYALGNTGGRPAKYKTPEDLHNAISAYFEYCGTHSEHPTTCGLALALGFESRQSLYTYRDMHSKKDKEFFYIIKRALTTIELHYETKLNSASCTGAIFALKNMDWSDKHEYEHSGKDGGPIETKAIHDKETLKRFVLGLFDSEENGVDDEGKQ